MNFRPLKTNTVLGVWFITPLLLFLFGGTSLDQVSFQNLNTFHLEELFRVGRFTFLQALLSASLCVVFALAAVRSYLSLGNRFLKIFIWISIIPFSLPSILICLSFVLAFGRSGIWNQYFGFFVQSDFLFTRSAVVIAHVYFNLGFATNLLLNQYRKIPISDFITVKSLSLSEWQKFRMLEIPNLLPTLKKCFFVVFCFSFSSFAIAMLLGGGPNASTLEVLIYESVKFEGDFLMALLGSAVGLPFLIFLQLLLFWKSGFLGTSKNSNQNADADFSAYVNLPFGVSAFVFSVFACFISLPIISYVSQLFGSFFQIPRVLLNLETSQAIWNSFVLAGSVGLITLVLGVTICRNIAMEKCRNTKEEKTFSEFLIGLILGYSPTILGFAWMLVSVKLGLFDSHFIFFFLVLIHSGLVLPVFCSMLLPSYVSFYSSFNETMSLLNLNQRIRYSMEFHAMKRSILLGGFVCFAFSWGETSASMMFGNEDFKTLPVLMFEWMQNYRYLEASILGVILMCICGASFFFAGKYSK